MITRIVRMEFQEGKAEAFLEIFRTYMDQIRHFPGVSSLELHRDTSNPNVFYTYSLWKDEDSLEAYRFSPLFRSVWPLTKALFAATPQAFSLQQEIKVE